MTLASLAGLFRAWHKHDVRYCHWKSTNHLRDTMEGRADVDVVVGRESATLAEELLVESGFRRFDTVPLRAYPGIADYACLDDSGTWVHVHLHSQLVLGDRWVKAYWLPTSPVVDRAQFSEEYQSFVVDGHDELFLLCARMALKFSRPFSDERVWEEILFVRDRARSSPFDQSGYERSVPEISELVEHVVSSEEPSRRWMNRQARRVRSAMAELRRFGWLRFASYSLLRQVYRYAIEFRRRIVGRYESGRRRIRTGGALVAFVGIDGSGKTSAVSRMESLFAKQMNVERVFLGNGRSGASWYRRIFFALLGTRAKLKGHRALRTSGAEGPTRPVPWYYAAWIMLCTFDKQRDLRKAVAGRANGALVLSDRWPQGQVRGACDGPRIHGRSELSGLAQIAADGEAQLLERSRFVKPDLIIRLLVSPGVALARKPDEFSEAEATATDAALRSIRWPDVDVVDIDADAPVEAVDEAIRTAVWAKIRR